MKCNNCKIYFSVLDLSRPLKYLFRLLLRRRHFSVRDATNYNVG